MAAEVKATPLIRQPVGPATLTPEQRYWKTFRSHTVIATPVGAPVTHIHTPIYPLTTSPQASDLFAVTSGARLQLYSTRTRKLVKTITRFSDTAYSAQLRRDGRVVAAGDETGHIQVFDANSRAILKSWNTHKQPVWRVAWNPADTTGLMSGSDDRTVRLWDLASDEPVATFSGHQDYVRSGDWLSGQAQGLIASGSYDQTVRIWDPRSAERAAMVFKHDAPIEAVLPMPGGTTILAGAGEKISVLDIVGGKPLRVLQNHQKAVTSLCLGNNGERVLSGGLDGHVKIFETESWNVVTGIKYPSPVLSLGVASTSSGKEDRHLVVGLMNGNLSIRTRLSGVAKAKQKEKQREMAALEAGTIEQYDRLQKRKERLTSGAQKRLRGRDFTGEGADVIIEGNPRPKTRLQPWQRELRNGKYALALDRVLETGDLQAIVTALVALRHRSATRAALCDRIHGDNEEGLLPILKFVCKYIIDPRHVALCVDVGTLLLDLYAGSAGQSPEVDGLWKRLHSLVRSEVDRAQQAWQTQGMLGLLMAP